MIIGLDRQQKFFVSPVPAVNEKQMEVENERYKAVVLFHILSRGVG